MTPGTPGIETQIGNGIGTGTGTGNEIGSETMTETEMAEVEAEVVALGAAVLLVAIGLLAVAAGMTTVGLPMLEIGRRHRVDETTHHLGGVGDLLMMTGAVALRTGQTTAIRDHSVSASLFYPGERRITCFNSFIFSQARLTIMSAARSFTSFTEVATTLSAAFPLTRAETTVLA